MAKLTLGVLVLFGFAFFEAHSDSDDPLRALADRRGLLIGNVLSDSFGWKNEPRSAALARRELNAGLLELYWRSINSSAQGEYDFSYPDHLLDEAQKARQTVLGHAIVYSYPRLLPDWLIHGSFSREEYVSILKKHIRRVMRHYAGKIDTFIVVNEYNQGTQDDFESQDFFFKAIGPDYLEIAFAAARSANPKAKLIYNDYNNETSDGYFTKSTRKIIKRLKRRQLIDGVGIQMHLDGSLPPQYDDMVKTLKRYRLPIYVTEFDVDIRNVDGTEEERWSKQAKIYQTVISAALQVGCRLRYFGFWGTVDHLNWRESDPGATETSEFADAGIFDDAFMPKPSYLALSTTLRASDSRLCSVP